MKGFSLLEVVMSLGILSFSLVAIMGLIPVGLQTSRQSMDRNTETRILQTVRASMQNMSYSTMPAEGAFIFDVDGFPLQATSDGHYEVSYSVREEYQDGTGTGVASTILPGTQRADRLKTVNLTITNLLTKEERINALHLPDNGF